MERVFYYTQQVPGSQPTFLNIQSVIDLSEKMGDRAFDKVVRYVARKMVVERSGVRKALGGGDWTGYSVLEGVRRTGLDPRLVLSEVGFDAVAIPADNSVHPLANDSEYDPMGKVKLAEHAEKCGFTKVWRVRLAATYAPTQGIQAPMKSATRDTSVTGALSNSPTSQPPRTQRLAVPSQDSTKKVTPSVTPRQSDPSTNLGSSITDGSMPNSMPQLKIGDRHPSTKRPIYHDTDDLDDLMTKAKDAFPIGVNMLSKVAGMVPGAHFEAPGEGTKGMARIKTNVERIRQKLGNGRAVSNLSDIMGGRIWVDDMKQVQSVVDQLAAESGGKIVPGFDEDFTGGTGRGGYRARHVQVPIPGTGLSMEVQVMPKEIGQVQEEAHKHYDKFRDPSAPLADIIEGKEKSSKIFNEAFRQHVNRVTGTPVNEHDSLFGPTAVGESQTDARDGQGRPVPVSHEGDMVSESDSGYFLDAVNPLDNEGDLPSTLAADLDRGVGVKASKVGEAYNKALEALAAKGDQNPRETLHKLFKANGFDAIRFNNQAGKRSWLPMSKDQIYDPSVAKSEPVQVKMSEFANKKGMIKIRRNGEEIRLAEDFHGWEAAKPLSVKGDMEFRHGEGRLYVGYKGHPVGSLEYAKSDVLPPQILDAVVQRPHRGKGIGKALYQEFLGMMADEGYGEVLGGHPHTGMGLNRVIYDRLRELGHAVEVNPLSLPQDGNMPWEKVETPGSKVRRGILDDDINAAQPAVKPKIHKPMGDPHTFGSLQGAGSVNKDGTTRPGKWKDIQGGQDGPDNDPFDGYTVRVSTRKPTDYREDPESDIGLSELDSVFEQ